MTQAALGRPSTILTARINYSGEYLLDQIQSKRVYRPIHGRPAPGVQRGPIVGGDLTAPTKVSHRTGIVSMGNHSVLLMHMLRHNTQFHSVHNTMERDAGRPA